MKKKAVVFAVVFAFLIVSAGCIFQNDFDSGFAELKEIRQRYGLEQELGPAEPEKTAAFKSEIDNLKQRTKSSEFSSLLDIQKNNAETIESLVMAELEIARLNTENMDCGKESPIENAIALLEKAESRSSLAQKKLESFKNANPGLAQQLSETGFDSERLKTLNLAISGQLEIAKELKFYNCP